MSGTTDEKASQNFTGLLTNYQRSAAAFDELLADNGMVRSPRRRKFRTATFLSRWI